MSEQDLVQRVIAGNGAAREAFYDRYNKLAWSIIIEMIDGEEDRNDLFQVFFAHVFKEDCRCLRQWHGENLPAFLASTLRHLGIDFLRKRRAERKQVLNWPDVGTDDGDSSQTSCDLPDPEPSPETRLLIDEMSGTVKAAIAQLSERDQELIRRHYLDEQTYDEIAP
jgi:RNA polymerase sigma factor (sigma-70 family)